jgi:hypothetical protein
MIDPLEPRQAAETTTNGAGPAENVPPLETLLYEAGLITPDQLGELVRDSVVLRRPVATVAVERGWVSPEAIQVLLAQAFAERVDDSAAETWGHVSHQPPPDASPQAVPAYALVLRLQNGERVIVDRAVTFECAAEMGRALATRFATEAEWPLVAGRFIRPEVVVSVDIERPLEA